MSIWVDANGWPVPPMVLLGCLAAEILYFRGWNVLVNGTSTREGAERLFASVPSPRATGEEQRRIWFWRSIFFFAAIFTFLLAACAPIDTLASRFFWVHMVQHLLLLVVMAPLLVAGAPLLPCWLGLPVWFRRLVVASVHLRVRRACYHIIGWLRGPVISCSLLLVGTWVWHWPPLYDFALTNDFIHDWCEHSTFLAVSVLFWAQVIPSPPFSPRFSYPGRMAYIGVAIVQNVVLAVLLGFAVVPLYAPYAHQVTLPGNLSPLLDQQFGAGIMWTFGDVPFGIAISVLVQRWFVSQPADTSPQHAGVRVEKK
ncbi:MAG TPA: cytochrome c oxidase assembly protein [Ktedonobacteraceae bacterium]